MFHTLKKVLSIRSINDTTQLSEVSEPLFSGSAYFSNRVPKVATEKWVAHGGQVSSGTTFDARARFFFAMDPSEPWVTKLFAKSVVVIHAGWIVHCVDEAFQVPIAEYILDDRFVPGPPYKLTDIALRTYVPLSEPDELSDTESTESELIPVQVSDTPSTPTSMRRKRKREQAYYDSPSGSLVFSGFDKDGMPRRPRKQRRLRFDPSFSPESGRSGGKAKQGSDPEWLRDHGVILEEKFIRELGRHSKADALHGLSYSGVVMEQPPNIIDKPLDCGAPFSEYQRPSSDEHLSTSTGMYSPAASVDPQVKTPPVRTIDFTNLPPPTRRWRFPPAHVTNSDDTGLEVSVVKPAERKDKTPKKISFANQAQVCVYMVSPRREDIKNNTGAGPAPQPSSNEFEDGRKENDETWIPSNGPEGSDDSAPEAIKNSTPQIDSTKIDDAPFFRHLGRDQLENDTLTLTAEEVQAMRRRLLDSAADGADTPRLATLFELGKTFRGMEFRHVW